MSKHAPPYPNAETDPFNQVPGMNRPPMTAEPDLLPCPFCGLDVTDDEGCFPLNREGTRWEVRCGNPSCFAHDPCDESMQAAVARWNRRATAAVDEAAAIRAFEEHFEASAEDPSFEGELELWLTAWRKALDSTPQRPAAVDGAYPTPRNRAEAVALTRLALAYLGVIDAHIDAAIARCETDLATQHQEPTT